MTSNAYPSNTLRFYRKYYQPDNAMVVVAGQFDEAKALAFIHKYLGPIPRPQRQLDTTYTEEPEQDGERLVMLRRVGHVGAVGVVYHIPSGPHPQFPALQVLANILSTQPSGRLQSPGRSQESDQRCGVCPRPWRADAPGRSAARRCAGRRP